MKAASAPYGYEHTGHPSTLQAYPPAGASTFGSPPFVSHGPQQDVQLQQPAVHGTAQPHPILVRQHAAGADNAAEPNTTVALVLATLSAILCNVVCGAAGIVFAWKARMQTLDKKYAHARHTLCVVWIFLFLTVLFGLIAWATIVLTPIVIYSYMNKH